MFSALKESISVSKAASQFALPLIVTTFFVSSVTGSPKGSAVCTAAGGAAGVWAAAGGDDGAGAGLAEEVELAEGAGVGAAAEVGLGLGEGAGPGEAAGEGVAVGEAAGAGDCARTALIGRAAAIMPARIRRKARERCIGVSLFRGVACPDPRPRKS
ncbi:hypothetical protein ES703_63571 [subsurface metagenome]